MPPSDSVERILRAAAPHELLDEIRALLVSRHGALSVELLLADYSMTRLQPLTTPPHGAEPVSVYSTAPGRAFGAQEPYLVEGGERVVVHLPVSVRGDRLGVLSVTLPANAGTPEVRDELGLVADAFGHELLVAERDTDLFRRARRTDRLTLAAEMQWQLLPGRSCARPEYSLGAQLEPAYAVYGDSFDWSTSADHLFLTVNNGMGDGIDAALLTNLAVNAVRNARRAGLGLVDQASLADQAVHGQYRGERHLAMLLLDFHLDTGRVEIVDAGSPKVWRLRDGNVETVELEAQLPLGMFEDTVYTCQELRVEPGDRLVFASDGVYDVASPSGESYGLRALARAVTSTRLLPPSQVPGAILEHLAGHRGAGVESTDDATVVCLDWVGHPARGA